MEKKTSWKLNKYLIIFSKVDMKNKGNIYMINRRWKKQKVERGLYYNE